METKNSEEKKRQKIYPLQELVRIRRELRRKGKKVVFTDRKSVV
jgi:translation initiation factor 1 (eIF-1/SUI1)